MRTRSDFVDALVGVTAEDLARDIDAAATPEQLYEAGHASLLRLDWTHKEKRPAGYPADRRVTLGGAQCACVANAPVAQLPLVSEPAHTGLGQMSRAEGEAARDAVPAPPGRAAGVHVFDLRGPQPQGVAS